jgi:hypothetical protein
MRGLAAVRRKLAGGKWQVMHLNSGEAGFDGCHSWVVDIGEVREVAWADRLLGQSGR